MKKLFIKVLLIIGLFTIPHQAFAAGGFGLSHTNITLTKGQSSTVTISVTNAAGRIDISSSNPGVASVSKGSEFVDAYAETRNYTFTITANASGSAVITVSPYDLATYDKEVVSGARRINITVNEPAPAPTQAPIPSNPTPNNPTPSNPTPSNPAQNPTEEDNRSTNAGLSSLTINGKQINAVDNVYQLEVGNYLEKVEIAAKTSDNKAKLSGIGNKDIKVGENSFEIIVTAENESTKTYTIKVIRKEYNSLSDLDEILKLNRDIEIRLNDNDKLSKEQLEKISKSKNIITLTKFSKDNKVLYSWILDGSKLKSVKEFNPNITMAENNNDIEEAMNYADGIYLDFSKCKDIPKGTILRYYVGDKYKAGDKVNLYAYNSNKVTQIKENIVVKDGYIEFEVTDEVKHVITKAKVLNRETNELNIWFIISMVLTGVVVLILLFAIISKIKNKKKVEIDSEFMINAESENFESNNTNNDVI